LGQAGIVKIVLPLQKTRFCQATSTSREELIGFQQEENNFP
jgi:hypothetical protein